MSSSVNEEIGRPTEQETEEEPADLQSTQSAPQGCGLIIKEEPDDNGYERILENSCDDQEDDDPSSTTKAEDEESLPDTKVSSADDDDDGGEPIDVVIKLEPEDGSEGSETEIDEDRGDVNPSEEEDERENSCAEEGEQKSNSITTTITPTVNTRGLFKGDKLFQCEECEKIYSSKHHLDVHQKTHKCRPIKNSVALDEHDGSNTKEKQFECKICGFRLSTPGSLRRHENEHAGLKPFKCQHCDRTFSRQSGCKEHEKRHSGIRPFKCKYCNRTFFTPWELKNHISTHSEDDKQYSCKVCLEKFPTESERDTHQAAVHGGDNPFRCEFCDASFSEMRDLSKHEKQQHKNARIFKCPTCDKEFSKRSSYNDHQKVHKRKKTVKCHICNYSSHQQNLIDTHMRVHTGEKPYKCNYCQRTFSGLGNCRRHERAHRGEKPYPCKFCNKPFVCGGDRRVHERLHTGEKPFKCKYCGEGFIKSYYRTVHERRHEEWLPQEEVHSTHGPSSNDAGVPSSDIDLVRMQSYRDVVANMSNHCSSSGDTNTETAPSDERDFNIISSLSGDQSLERSGDQERRSGALVSRETSQGQVLTESTSTLAVIKSIPKGLTQHVENPEVKRESLENVDISKVGHEVAREQLGPVLAQYQDQRTLYSGHGHHHHHHSPGPTVGPHQRLRSISPPFIQHRTGESISLPFVQQQARDSSCPPESFLGHYGPKDIRPSTYYPPSSNNHVLNLQMASHLRGIGQIYYPPPSHDGGTGSLNFWQHLQQGTLMPNMGPPQQTPMGPIFPTHNGHL